jgi:uncharacterized protein (TIGR02265 family)
MPNEPIMGKAAGFTTAVALLREMLGAARFADVYAAASAETRELIDHPPLAMGWLDLRPWFELLEVAERVEFGGRTEAMADLGRAQMRHDMSGIYKVFVRFATPESILKKTASIYGMYSKNGTMSARQLGPGAAEIELKDVRYTTPGFWAFQRGCILGVLEIAGVKGAECELRSGGGNSSEGVFTVRWR